MAIDGESKLSKGDLRKLNALRKSVGDKLGERTFIDWKKQQPALAATAVDRVAVKIEEALVHLGRDAKLRLGNKGYTIKKSRGKGASGRIVATRNE